MKDPLSVFGALYDDYEFILGPLPDQNGRPTVVACMFLFTWGMDGLICFNERWMEKIAVE